jgi:peptide-methionine (S)-S-oxide reductase
MKRFLRIAKKAAFIVALAVPLTAAAQTPAPVTAKATFAGGCFWCVESDFDKVPGVISTTSGYTGGATVNPTYAEVGSGRTGHAESVEVVYDPAKVTYEQLLDAFWHNIDPLVKDRQFCDIGNEYRTAIFTHDEEQRRLAEESKKRIEAQLKAPVHTEIVNAGPFYRAEEYHQDYYLKNPVRYKYYRWSCGRDQRLEQIWGKKSS